MRVDKVSNHTHHRRTILFLLVLALPILGLHGCGKEKKKEEEIAQVATQQVLGPSFAPATYVTSNLPVYQAPVLSAPRYSEGVLGQPRRYDTPDGLPPTDWSEPVGEIPVAGHQFSNGISVNEYASGEVVVRRPIGTPLHVVGSVDQVPGDPTLWNGNWGPASRGFSNGIQVYGTSPTDTYMVVPAGAMYREEVY